MDEEMRTHLEMEIEELVRSGVPPGEARRRAALAFGGVTRRKEEATDSSGVAWLMSLRRDVRIAVRTLFRYRTFTVTAVLALALANAVNTTTYSIIDAMMHPYVSIAHPDRLFMLRYWSGPHGLYGSEDLAARTTNAIRSVEAIDGITETGWGNTVIAERGRRASFVMIHQVRPDFFQTMEMVPVDGRLTPGPNDATAGGAMVISERMRAELFGTGEPIAGASVTLGGKAYRVIGVATRYGDNDALDCDAWVFVGPEVTLPGRVVRLKRGYSRAEAERLLVPLAQRLAVMDGKSPGSTRFELKSFNGPFTLKRFHYALIGAAIAILIVACTNMANLQLARGLTRSTELAVRSSLGASRRQIVAQLLIESGVIAVLALLVALSFTLISNGLLRATVPPDVGDYIVKPILSWRLGLVATAAAVLCMVSIGLFPALRASRVDLNTLLKGRAGTGMHRSNRRIYSTLVVVQIAMTLPLAAAAVLMSRAAWHTADMSYMISEYIGYDPRPIIDATVFFQGNKQDGTFEKVSLSDITGRFIAAARATPGVRSAAVAIRAFTTSGTVSVDDPDGAFHDVADPMGPFNNVTADYPRVMGMPFRRGGSFVDGASSTPTVVIDERTAHYLWPHSSPVGRMIRFGSMYKEGKLGPALARVIGVVGDGLSDEARELKNLASPSRLGEMYQVITTSDSISAGRWRREFTLKVRAQGDLPGVINDLRERLRSVSAGPPIVQTESEYLGIPQRMKVQAFIAALFTTFGVLALCLSALGVYAIVAQSVIDRQREVAVRIALGATPKAIVRALIRDGNVLVLAGVAIGLFLTKLTLSWVEAFTAGTDIYNAPLFGAVCIGLFSAMVLAAIGPAVRATRLDPMEVLRAE